MATSPGTSICFSSGKCGSSSFTSNATPTVMKMPGTMLIKNSQCHERKLVSQPPKAGPMVGASVTMKLTTTVTLVCRARPNIRKDAA